MAAKKKIKKTSTNKKLEITWNVAKQGDGTIQITYTIPHQVIEKKKTETAKEMAKDVDVPGFRKGMAPTKKVIEHIKESTLIDKTLQSILPSMFGESIEKEMINPAIYPRFELIKAKEGEDWQIRATTAELPEVSLGDYKKKIKDEGAKDAIWTPEKGNEKKEKKEPTQEEKEQKALEILMETVDIKVPKALVEEEVNARLSRLLERIENLGLTLESYLTSTNHTSESLRQEYEKQAESSLIIDLALTKIAEEEGLEADKKELEELEQGDNKISSQQRTIIEGQIRKKEALKHIASLL